MIEVRFWGRANLLPTTHWSVRPTIFFTVANKLDDFGHGACEHRQSTENEKDHWETTYGRFCGYVAVADGWHGNLEIRKRQYMTWCQLIEDSESLPYINKHIPNRLNFEHLWSPTKGHQCFQPAEKKQQKFLIHDN